MADVTLKGLLGEFRNYLRDASPGGLLNPEITPERAKNALEYVSMTPTPFGDAASGLLAGNYLMKGQFGDAGLEAIGLLPFVPGMTKAVKKVWYHGSPYDIYNTPEKWFKPVKGDSGVPVVWGTDDMLAAEGYARGESSFIPDANGKMPLTKSWYKDYDGKGGVYALRNKGAKTFEYDANGKDWFLVPQSKIIKEASEKGYDAVVFKNIKDNMESGGLASDVIAWINSKAIEKATDF